MCALRSFHWNLITGNFFTQDCEKKKIDCMKKQIQKMCSCMLVMVHELADIGRSIIAKYNILLGGCLCCTFSNSQMQHCKGVDVVPCGAP